MGKQPDRKSITEGRLKEYKNFFNVFNDQLTNLKTKCFFAKPELIIERKQKTRFGFSSNILKNPVPPSIRRYKTYEDVKQNYDEDELLKLQEEQINYLH